jgi:glycosyltransferase involved in cell wall biosynthesis
LKILFLCKRRPLAKDLFTRPYGRFYYLPKLLSERGHEIHIALLSYRNEGKISEIRDGLHWSSVSIFNWSPLAYIAHVKKLVRDIQPDWIAGVSDTYYGILAQRLGRKYGINSLIDAYDNFESYIPWLKPLHQVWRRALAEATLVTAAGPALAALLGRDRHGKSTVVIPMAADQPDFRPMDMQECRSRLELPANKKLIGYCGSISPSRGVDILFSAYEELRKSDPEMELVLCGRKDADVTLPDDAIWLEHLPDEMVPVVFNSLDLLAVINKPSSFGNYSYPVKLYEAMRCRIPVVASNTPATSWILRNYTNLLVEPGDSGKLCNRIREIMASGRIDYECQPDWESNCDMLEKELISHYRKTTS